MEDNGNAIRQQCIWHNKAVKVQGRTLASRAQIDAGVVLINDFVDSEGIILTHEAFTEKHPAVRTNPLTYMGWCRAIPRRWKALLAGSATLTAEQRNRKPSIEIKGK